MHLNSSALDVCQFQVFEVHSDGHKSKRRKCGSRLGNDDFKQLSSKYSRTGQTYDAMRRHRNGRVRPEAGTKRCGGLAGVL